MKLKLAFVFLLGLTLILSSIVVDSYSKHPMFSFNDPSTYQASATNQNGRTYFHSIASQASVDVYYTVSSLKAVSIDEKAGIHPNRLTVNKGDYIKLMIKNNYEATCVFTVEGYGIKVPLRPKAVSELEFNAAKEGHYAVGCRPVCNCIHDLKLGILEVTK